MASSRPKLSSTVNLIGLTAETNGSLPLFCPAQGFPLPSYRYGYRRRPFNLPATIAINDLLLLSREACYHVLRRYAAPILFVSPRSEDEATATRRVSLITRTRLVDYLQSSPKVLLQNRCRSARAPHRRPRSRNALLSAYRVLPVGSLSPVLLRV